MLLLNEDRNPESYWTESISTSPTALVTKKNIDLHKQNNSKTFNIYLRHDATASKTESIIRKTQVGLLQTKLIVMACFLHTPDFPVKLEQC